MKHRKQFDAFWRTLHQELDKPVKITNWTVAGRTRSQKTFSAWSGKGKFSQKIFFPTGSRPNPTALYCNTLNTKNLRIIYKAEARNIYNVWPKYLNTEISRSKIRDTSKNLTYIFGIFHKFEDLMLGRIQ